MSVSTFKNKQCKLAPTVTVLCTHNFACTNVCTKLFYVYENQCMQILNLSSPGISLLPLILKIIENSIHNQMKDYLQRNNFPFYNLALKQINPLIHIGLN